MSPPALSGLLWALASSLLVHGAAYGSLLMHSLGEPIAPLPSEVRFEVEPARPRPPTPAPPPPPPETPEPPKPEAPPPHAPRAPSPPPPVPPPSVPVDLSGLTLTNDSGAGTFAMRASDAAGLDARAPAPPPPRPSAERVVPAAPSVPNGPAFVALGDLSSRPAPPSLEGALRANYPAEARTRGLGGSASVRARIDPDGVVRKAQVVGDSGGFGAACRKSVLGSRWSPPRDRMGRAVATEVRYTCRFVVSP